MNLIMPWADMRLKNTTRRPMGMGERPPIEPLTASPRTPYSIVPVRCSTEGGSGSLEWSASEFSPTLRSALQITFHASQLRAD